MTRAALADALRDVVGADAVVEDPELLVGYETDWMGRRFGAARVVVRPASTEEVAGVIAVCGRHSAAVVPQGGNTGLVAGGVPRDGEVVLSTGRLAWVGEADPVSGTVAAGAGAPLAAVREAARAAGFDLGIDLGARDTATVGGMAATNAGGLRVIRYGHMRAQLAGLEAVTPDGRVIRRMAGLAKDTAGYDLTGLLCGSEGTLGVITAVLLHMVPAAHQRVTAVIGLESTGAALGVLGDLRRRVPELDAAEIVFADGVARVTELFGTTSVVDPAWPCQLLVEASAPTDADSGLVDRVAGSLGGASDPSATAVALDDPARQNLWSMRERHPELVVRLGYPHKLDVSLPLRRLPEFETEVRARLASTAPDATLILYGHIGDGGLHVNVAAPPDAADASGSPPGSPAAHREWMRRVDEVVLGLVGDLGGSISAEHGIGTEKVAFLGLTRGPAEIDAMRRLKAALDPDGILNPGVLLG